MKPARQLFFEFVARALDLPQGSVIGIQDGNGSGDLILFNTSRRVTLAVPLNLLWEDSAAAREVVRNKVRDSESRFRGPK